MYYNNLCLIHDEISAQDVPREFFNPLAICPCERPATKPTTLRDTCIRHLHTNLAFTTQADERSTFFDFTPQKKIIPKLDIPRIFQAELLMLHEQCGLHGHRVYERSNNFSRGLMYIKGDSPLYLFLKNMGKPGERILHAYYRLPDFLYELTRLVPFLNPSGFDISSQEFLGSIKESIVFSKRVD